MVPCWSVRLLGSSPRTMKLAGRFPAVKGNGNIWFLLNLRVGVAVEVCAARTFRRAPNNAARVVSVKAISRKAIRRGRNRETDMGAYLSLRAGAPQVMERCSPAALVLRSRQRNTRGYARHLTPRLRAPPTAPHQCPISS